MCEEKGGELISEEGEIARHLVEEKSRVLDKGEIRFSAEFVDDFDPSIVDKGGETEKRVRGVWRGFGRRL